MTTLTEPCKPLTLHRLREMSSAGEKIALLTCYDATFARLLDNAGVDCLLVGDSLGMVLQSQPTTRGSEYGLHAAVRARTTSGRRRGR